MRVAAPGFAFTVASCNLNIIPAGRLDPNAITLLDLYPDPTNGSLLSNFANSPKLFEHRNAFDARTDFNFNDKNQLFFRFSFVDDPQFIPGIFGGVADGGGFQQATGLRCSAERAELYAHILTDPYQRGPCGSELSSHHSRVPIWLTN